VLDEHQAKTTTAILPSQSKEEQESEVDRNSRVGRAAKKVFQ
jgi:hypothetical protein